jgi:hypothetical protein
MRAEGVEEDGERRLAQWMLDGGTPPTQVFELLGSTAGLARGARVARALDVSEKDPPARLWRARFLGRVAS